MGGRRKFILVPTGSAGDVDPFVWLGEGLRARGHDVCAIIHPPFAEAMHAARIRAVTYGTAEDFEVVTRHPDLWHPRRGFALIARMSERWYRHAVPHIKDELAPKRATIIGAGIAFAARLAAEAFDVPLVTIQLQPAAFLSVRAPPVLLAGWEWLRRAPPAVRRLVYRLVDARTDQMLADDLNDYRAELGLARPVRRILREYWMSPGRVVALFPEWFAPPQPDWPPQTVVTRFPLYDHHRGVDLPPELEPFLAAGTPPVLFTVGSANLQAKAFFAVARETCRRLGCRGLFVTRFGEQLFRELPPTIRHYAEVPFSRVFPRCQAVVHHGGIGTLAQALAAGVPQLAMPMSHDQPDNGARLRRLGVGDYLYPRRFTAARVTALLRRLTASADVARACQACRERTRHQMPAEAVFQLFEEVA